MQLNTILRYTALGGIFLMPLIPFIVVPQLFFPFIGGKNFAFRIIVEIIFFAWAALATRNPDYRPRKTPILLAFVLFVATIFLSSLFSENFYASFCSNAERMDGLITHLHLLAYFIVMISVLKTEKLWRWFWHISIGVSIFLSIYGILQSFGIYETHQGAGRVDATLGNATYLATYMLFHIFIAGYYLLQAKSKNYTRYIYGGIILLQSVALYLTATRGAILGFIGGVFITALLSGVLGGKKSRNISITVAGVLIAVVLGFVSIKDTNFVRENAVLKRFASISLTERTVTSRFVIWKMSIEGFKEKPVLGYGVGGFEKVFNTYYKPELWQQEMWFDRAHNAVFDWLIAGGLVGLLAYFSLFGTALYSLWKYAHERSIIEKALFTGLFGAYFFQNLFVFDNITSYIFFFSALAFISSTFEIRDGRFKRLLDKISSLFSYPIHSGSATYTVAPVVFGILCVAALYYVNVPQIQASHSLIEAISQQDSVSKNYDYFKDVFEKNTFINVEGLEQLLHVASRVVSEPNLGDETKNKFIDLARAEAEKQIAKNPENVRLEFFYGAFLASVGRYTDALSHLERAHELSPKKQVILLSIVDVYLNLENADGAIATAREAYELDQSYGEAGMTYAIVLFGTNYTKEAQAILVATFETDTPRDIRFVNVYVQKKMYGKVIEVWQKFIEARPDVTQYRVSLAAAYFQNGQKQKAIEALEEAIKIDPEFKEQGQAIINDIRAGRNPLE